MNLNTTWKIYYHCNNNKSWNIQSYILLLEISTIQDFWEFFNNLPELINGSFYIMRENIFPVWEDPLNINGGSWNFFTDMKNIKDYFINLSIYLVGETLCNLNNEISGFSITPKKNNFSLKIWNTNCKNSNKFIFNKNIGLKYLNYKAFK